MENKLEKLLLEKSFSMLSPLEKAYVLSQITEVDYHKFHFILVASKNSFEEECQKITVNNSVRETLILAFKKRHKKTVCKPYCIKKLF